MSQPQAKAASAVSLYDARPFFEKALLFGVQHGILDQSRLDAIAQEAPKGMVQIARYFGSEFLRPELEKARDRIVNLVSLHLQDASVGDLRVAAELLRDHSFLSRSKAGSDMLRALIVMPRNPHLGMSEHLDQAQLKERLALWSLASNPEYRAELAVRQPVAKTVEAAFWLADQLGMSADDLQDCHADAEAVIRTALLTTASRYKEMPDWVAFEKMIGQLRRKDPVAVASALILPNQLPPEYRTVVVAVLQGVLTDLPRLLDPHQPVRKLFSRSNDFTGRYFWIEDVLSEVSHYDSTRSAAWDKLTQSHADDSTLLTLFLCMAAGTPPKTLLTDKSAAALIRKIRKTGLHPELASSYIQANAPEQHQDGYNRLWLDFVSEAQATLLSDRDGKLTDALALLRRECNVS